MKSELTPLQIWVLAIRPKTLPASTAGVVAGIAIAIFHGGFRWLPALAAMGVGLLLQIASNLANDVFDYQHGTDTPDRLGPTRVTQAGYLTPRQVKTGLAITILLAGLLGIYLAITAGWEVLLIGAAAILAAIFYTAGPYPLGYHGFGDLFVFLFFGLAAVNGTYYVQTEMLHPAAWAISVSVGLLVVNLLVVNNLRDIPTDSQGGKKTLAVKIGAKNTMQLYRLWWLLAYMIIPITVILGWLPVWAFLTWISLPQVFRLDIQVRTLTGKALNPVLGATSQQALIFSLLLLAGMLLSRWLG